MALLTENQIIPDSHRVERSPGKGPAAGVDRVPHPFQGYQAMNVLNPPAAARKRSKPLLSGTLLLSHIGHPNTIRVFRCR
jgi:hypothetical protein